MQPHGVAGRRSEQVAGTGLEWVAGMRSEWVAEIKSEWVAGLNRNPQTGSLKGQNLCIYVFELGITVGVLVTFIGLEIALAAVSQTLEENTDCGWPHFMSHGTQGSGKLG